MEWESRLEQLYPVELLVPQLLLYVVLQLSNKDHKAEAYKGIVNVGYNAYNKTKYFQFRGIYSDIILHYLNYVFKTKLIVYHLIQKISFNLNLK